MILFYDLQVVELYSENENEFEIISSTYLKTKIAYIASSTRKTGIKIDIKGNEFVLEIQEGYACIPEKLSLSEIGYLLRVIIDSYIVYRRALPLHASMTKYNNKGVFIFGETNSGKTVYANHLKKKYPIYNVIGDDHIIVSSKGVVGNAVSRIRSNNDKTVYVQNKQQCDNVDKYIIFDADINSSDKRSSYINNSEYYKYMHSHITKYLTKDFSVSEKTYYIEKMVGFEVYKQYLARLEQFINNATAIIEIRGDLKFVTETINNVNF